LIIDLDADIEKSSNVEFTIPLQTSTDEKNKLIDSSEIPNSLNKTAVKGELNFNIINIINFLILIQNFNVDCRQGERFRRDEQLWK
jgi:hypothetical protein